MRIDARILSILLLLILAGCIETQFTGGDQARCLDAAQAGVNRIPACADERECQTAWDNYPGVVSSRDFATQTNLFQAQKKMMVGWTALNRVDDILGKTQDACRSGDAARVFTNGIEAASQIKTALQASEQAGLKTQQALESAGEYGHRLELEKVRDSAAFEGYSRVLEVLQEWQTGKGTHLETQNMNESKVYFEHVAHTILENDIEPYQPNWKNAFGIYNTILKKNKQPAGASVLIFSPVWQSAVSSFSSESRIQHTLQLVEAIRIPEMVNQIEESVSPDGGIVFRWMERIQKMENGIAELEKEEMELEKSTREQIERIIQMENEWKEMQKEAEKWEDSVEIHLRLKGGENNQKNAAQTSQKIGILSARWAEIHAQRMENRMPLGARVAEWRKNAKEAGSLTEWFNQETARSENGVLRCQEWANEIGKSDLSSAGLQLDASEALREGTLLEKVQRCGKFIERVEKYADEIGNETVQERRATLIRCAELRMQYANAAGMDTEGETADFFEREFGLEAGVHACEASRLYFENEYNRLPDVEEWRALTNEANEKIGAWEHAAQVHPEWVPAAQLTQFPEAIDYFAGEGNPLTESERAKKKTALRNALDQIDEFLGVIIQNGLDATEWSVVFPSVVQADESSEVTLHGKWKNPFGRSIAHGGTFRIPTPIAFSSVESTPAATIEGGENGMIWSTDELPFPGAEWSGVGNEILVFANGMISVEQVAGTTAYVRETIGLASKLSSARVKWKRMLPMGIPHDRVHIMGEGHSISFEWSGNVGVIDEEIHAFPAERIIEYEYPDAVQVSVTNALPKTEGGETETVYELELESNLEVEITTSISTGITGDPVNTNSIVVMDEGGTNVPSTRNALWGIVLPGVVLHPHETKRVYVVVRVNDGLNDWQAWGRTLVDEANILKEDGSMAIALQAGRLITEIQSGWNARTLEEWAKKLPEWQARLEKLRVDLEFEQGEWASLEAEWKDVQEKVEDRLDWKEKINVKNGMLQATNAIRDESLTRFSEAVHALSTWIREQEAMPKLITLPATESDEKGVALSEVRTLMDEWKEKMEEYARGRALTCDKLAQVGFTCPIGTEKENQLQKEVKEILAQVGKDEKRWEMKSETERTAWAKERNKQWVEWKGRAEEGITLAENGFSSIRDTAEAMMDEMGEREKNESPDVQSAIAKARTAVENNEFGKAIFIAKSLRAYWQQTAPFTGLATIPPIAWPFLGMAIVIGGAWGYRNWKNEKKAEPIPISIPRAEAEFIEATERQEQGAMDVEDGFQSTPGENRSGLKTEGESESPLPPVQSAGARGKARVRSASRRKMKREKEAPSP